MQVEQAAIESVSAPADTSPAEATTMAASGAATYAETWATSADSRSPASASPPTSACDRCTESAGSPTSVSSQHTEAVCPPTADTGQRIYDEAQQMAAALRGLMPVLKDICGAKSQTYKAGAVLMKKIDAWVTLLRDGPDKRVHFNGSGGMIQTKFAFDDQVRGTKHTNKNGDSDEG